MTPYDILIDLAQTGLTPAIAAAAVLGPIHLAAAVAVAALRRIERKQATGHDTRKKTP